MSSYNHIPINFEQAKLIEKDNAHYYETPSGEIFPSITTILQKTMSIEKKESLQNWKEREVAAEYITSEAATIGTETHKLIENYINEVRQTDEIRLLSVAHFNNLIPFLQKIDDVHGTELRLYSYAMKLAGTADCIAEYEGELSIIDYKTSRKTKKKEWIDSYFMQECFYAIAWEERTGIPITQLVILVSSEKNSRMEFVKNTEDYKDLLTQRLNQYYDILE